MMDWMMVQRSLKFQKRRNIMALRR